MSQHAHHWGPTADPWEDRCTCGARRVSGLFGRTTIHNPEGLREDVPEQLLTDEQIEAKQAVCRHSWAGVHHQRCLDCGKVRTRELTPQEEPVNSCAIGEHIFVDHGNNFYRCWNCGLVKAKVPPGGSVDATVQAAQDLQNATEHTHYWFDLIGFGRKRCYCGAILNERERQFSDAQIAAKQVSCTHEGQQLFNDLVWRCSNCGKESGKGAGMLKRPKPSFGEALDDWEKQILQQEQQVARRMLGHSLGASPASIKLTPEAPTQIDLASSLERLFTFLARLNLQDHPVAEQREQVNLLHELGPKVRKLARFKKDGGVK